MATKDHYLSENPNINFDEPLNNNNQYSNLNLNHKYQILQVYNTRSKNTLKNSRKKENYDFTASVNLQAKKESSVWIKSDKYLSSNFLSFNQESGEEHEITQSKSINNSTLSLHISAYENLIEADTAVSNGGQKEGLYTNNEITSLIKQCKASKQVFSGSSTFNANPFEFPRQQKDQNNHPEMMQFKASQRLRNPNKENLNVNEKNTTLLASNISMNSGDPFLNCVDGSSSSTDDEDETEELINFMIAGCRPRISSRFTKVLSTLSESAAKKHRKITVDAIDITLSGNEDETFAYISFRHLDSCIPQRSNKHFPRNFFFKGNGVQGKDVLKNLSNCNVMNSACITNAGSCISLSKYPADMLQTFLTSSSDRSAVIQAPMTILYGYFSHKSLTKFLPLIESSNIILKCSSGFQRYRYYELIEKNRHQTSLHFDRHVIQKFSKKKHFSKLRQIVLSNPSIACLSFSCSFTKFNFEEFFKLITDPTFKLPNQTINLCFTFWCKNFSLLYEEINEKKDILEVILADRAQYSDSIRVRFHVAWDGSTVLALCPGEIERF